MTIGHLRIELHVKVWQKIILSLQNTTYHLPKFWKFREDDVMFITLTNRLIRIINFTK